MGGLRRVKSAISVARKVLEHTEITFLVGELATQFAQDMGFEIESLSTNQSEAEFAEWRANNCQPNYWVKVTPDARTSCGPYKPSQVGSSYLPREVSADNHDTIGLIAIDRNGWIAAG